MKITGISFTLAFGGVYTAKPEGKRGTDYEYFYVPAPRKEDGSLIWDAKGNSKDGYYLYVTGDERIQFVQARRAFWAEKAKQQNPRRALQPDHPARQAFMAVKAALAAKSVEQSDDRSSGS